MLKTTNKIYETQLIKISNNKYYAINKNNSVVYYADTKVKSLEMVFDDFIKDKSLVVFEDFDNNVIILVFTNSINESFSLNIEEDNSFNINKLENYISLFMVQNPLKNIYFNEDSLIKDKINLENFSFKIYKNKEFKTSKKRVPFLKTSKKYLLNTGLVLSVLLVLLYLFNDNKDHLNKQRNKTFNKEHEILTNELNLAKQEVEELKVLSRKDITILKSFDELKVKQNEQKKY